MPRGNGSSFLTLPKLKIVCCGAVRGSAAVVFASGFGCPDFFTPFARLPLVVEAGPLAPLAVADDSAPDGASCR